ncbi:hypothetical protein [Helicobacter pylori]|uniref:hypothetical protein n=1 Tax=Helicobacter pylori TaxID=210 RepID=UPI0019242261|nr:hypothetical protein [Helicobacter pylori]QQW72843.1 hypothetical protein HG579_00300 [Helicobacter pylori]
MSFDEETEDEDFEELIKEVEELENSYYFLKGENAELSKEKERLANKNDKLQKQVHELENSYHLLKNEKTDWLKEKERLKKEKHKLVIEKEILNDQLNASQKQMKELEQSQQVLENEKAGLTHENTKLKTEKTELIEKIKALATERDKLIASHQEKSDLDLDNRRLASANQDLKRQNRKLEENIALKERVDGLNEQLSKQQKPQ